MDIPNIVQQAFDAFNKSIQPDSKTTETVESVIFKKFEELKIGLTPFREIDHLKNKKIKELSSYEKALITQIFTEYLQSHRPDSALGRSPAPVRAQKLEASPAMDVVDVIKRSLTGRLAEIKFPDQVVDPKKLPQKPGDSFNSIKLYFRHEKDQILMRRGLTFFTDANVPPDIALGLSQKNQVHQFLNQEDAKIAYSKLTCTPKRVYDPSGKTILNQCHVTITTNFKITHDKAPVTTGKTTSTFSLTVNEKMQLCVTNLVAHYHFDEPTA